MESPRYIHVCVWREEGYQVCFRRGPWSSAHKVTSICSSRVSASNGTKCFPEPLSMMEAAQVVVGALALLPGGWSVGVRLPRDLGLVS